MECLFHYLDDFLVVGPPASNKCATSLNILLAMFARLGVPVAVEKLEGPSTSLTFLGIELHSRAMQMRLPHAKIQELQALIREWKPKRSCTRRELRSLAGKLQHACKVVRPGRTFLRRMFEANRAGEEGASSYSADASPSVRPRLVGGFPGILEWSLPAARGNPTKSPPPLLLRRLGKLGRGGSVRSAIPFYSFPF